MHILRIPALDHRFPKNNVILGAPGWDKATKNRVPGRFLSQLQVEDGR